MKTIFVVVIHSVVCPHQPFIPSTQPTLLWEPCAEDEVDATVVNPPNLDTQQTPSLVTYVVLFDIVWKNRKKYICGNRTSCLAYPKMEQK